MHNLKIYKKTIENSDDNYYYSQSRYYPISFLRKIKFFFGITYDEVNLLLIEVEKIKEQKKLKVLNQKKFTELTAKEREVFELVAQGLSTKEIAKHLFIQTTTISTHRKRIKDKLELNSLYDWFLFAKSIQ